MPRTVTIEKTLFRFDELSNRAKEKARDWWRDCENHDLDFDYDDFAECASILGIDLRQKPVKLMGGGTRYEPTIYWTGFASQGDGACFEGTYRYAKGAPKKMRQHAPLDTELHRIADELQRVQRKAFYRLYATMSHRGHYYHSGCMRVEIDDCGTAAEEQITQLMRDFADWIYRQLNAEYDYRMSNESVDENIRCNEYDFNEEGERA